MYQNLRLSKVNYLVCPSLKILYIADALDLP
jgi:hypothetical protein